MAIRGFLEDMQRTTFKGMGDRATYAAKRAKRVAESAKRQRQAALDRKVINARQLRADRLRALENLTASDGYLMAPDGPAAITAGQTALKGSEELEDVELQHLLRSCYVCKARFSKYVPRVGRIPLCGSQLRMDSLAKSCLGSISSMMHSAQSVLL